MPAGGEVCVAWREGPNAVEVVGEDDPGVDVEGGGCADFAYGSSEDVDLLDKEVGFTVEEVDCEEIGSARDTKAAIACHLGIVTIFVRKLQLKK